MDVRCCELLFDLFWREDENIESNKLESTDLKKLSNVNCLNFKSVQINPTALIVFYVPGNRNANPIFKIGKTILFSIAVGDKSTLKT